jgi:hypothetical protein
MAFKKATPSSSTQTESLSLSSLPQVDLSTLKLPDKPNEPPPNLTDYSWFFYGEKNLGKSTLSAKFPDVLAHFMFQINRRDIVTPIIPSSKDEPPLDWPRFQAYVTLLLKKHKKPGRVVLDDLDLCARSCQEHHSKLAGVKTLNGIKDNGKAWATMKADWDNTMAELLWAGWRITLTSHARVRPKIVRGIARDDMKEALESGVVISERQPTASGWAYEWAKMVCTFVGYMGWMGRNRAIYIRGSDRVFASAGGIADLHFLQPNKKGVERPGEPYDYFLTGRSPDEAFQRLSQAWDNKLEGGFVETEEFEELASS